jgi:hypothetical protein
MGMVTPDDGDMGTISIYLRVVSAKASFFCLIFSFNDSASLRAVAILSAMSELLFIEGIQAEMRGTGK